MDVWVVSASIFAEELFLMTPERVAVRLEEFQDEAEREYKKVPTESPDWSKAYSKTTNLEDTITLLRLTQAR